MTHTSTEQPEALPTPEAVMDQAQVFASAWALYGSGSILEPEDSAELASEEKEKLAVMVLHLHARAQELEAENAHLKDAAWTAIDALEASQAQRVPLSADEIKEPKNGEVWRVEWWNESLRMMLPSDKVLHRFNAYRNGTLQFTLKAHAHGITQEKQG